MNRRTTTIGAFAAVASVIAIPSIAMGNARRDTGSLSAMQAAENPYIAQLSGDAEVPAGSGDPDGSGGATVSIAVLGDAEAEACWDLSYSDIADPSAAHIHEAAAGSNGSVVVDLGTPGATSHSGCTDIDVDLANRIVAGPAGFYVNVHNSDFPDGAIRGQLADGPDAAGSAHFLPTSLRAYDSRNDTASDKLESGETRMVNLSEGVDGDDNVAIAVPPGATAAIVTLTATETDGPGFLSIYSADSAEPLTSNLNYTTAGLSVAVTTQVAVDSSGSINVLAGAAGTHFIVDVIGFYY